MKRVFPTEQLRDPSPASRKTAWLGGVAGLLGWVACSGQVQPASDTAPGTAPSEELARAPDTAREEADLPGGELAAEMSPDAEAEADDLEGESEVPPSSPGDDEGPPADTGVRTDRSYCDAMDEVFHRSCGNGSCHSNPGATIGDFAIDLEHAQAYVDRVSVRDPSCGLVIDSASPLSSLMITKVTGNFPAGCGGVMPVGSFDITDEQIVCLGNWLLQFER